MYSILIYIQIDSYLHNQGEGGQVFGKEVLYK